MTPPAKLRSTTGPAAQRLAPQYEVINGTIQLRAESVVLDGPVTELEAEDLVEVEEGAASRRITSSSFTKRSKNTVWTSAEVDSFYRALRKCGTNFEMIATLLRGRDRKQVRNRYKRELREHPERIEYASSHPVAITAEDIALLSGQAPDENPNV